MTEQVAKIILPIAIGIIHFGSYSHNVTYTSVSKHLPWTMKTCLQLLLLMLAFPLHGQTKCGGKDKIIGEWIEVTHMPGVHTNVDSLRQLVKSKTGRIGVWDFRSDNTYTYKDSYFGKNKRNEEIFTFDSEKCEIILWRKIESRTARKPSANLEIMFLEMDFMIYKSDDSPKGYYTYLMTRR